VRGEASRGCAPWVRKSWLRLSVGDDGGSELGVDAAEVGAFADQVLLGGGVYAANAVDEEL